MENNPLDTQTNTQNPSPEITPVIPVPETPHVPVRTYESDLEQALEGREGGVIKLAIEDETRKDEERKNLTLLSKKNMLYGIGALILIGLAVIAILFVKISTTVRPTIGEGAQRSALITFDTKKEIDTENKIPEKIKKELEIAVQQNEGKNDGITYLIPTEKGFMGKSIVSPKNLFKKTNAVFSTQFANGISAEYFYGVYKNTVGKNNAFMIFKSSNDEYAFAGLAEWESTLYEDVYQIFGIIPDEETRILIEKPFEDMLIANKNARVLLNKDDEVVLVTMFLNDGYVIIAPNMATLTEVTNRLYAKKVEK